MKSTGIVRKLDDLGRVVIPSEVRKAYNITVGDPIEICTDENNIILRKFVIACTVCGCETINLTQFKRAMLCEDCLSKLSK